MLKTKGDLIRFMIACFHVSGMDSPLQALIFLKMMGVTQSEMEQSLQEGMEFGKMGYCDCDPCDFLLHTMAEYGLNPISIVQHNQEQEISIQRPVLSEKKGKYEIN